LRFLLLLNGNCNNPAIWWPTAYFLAKQSGAKNQDPGLTPMDKKASETMMAMWVQFARTGNPNVKSQVEWPVYESSADQYLYIAEPLQAQSGFSKVAQKK
jgi:carboxylesterase type B